MGQEGMRVRDRAGGGRRRRKGEGGKKKREKSKEKKEEGKREKEKEMEKEKKRKSEREKERKKIEKEKGKKNGEKRKRKRGRESECAPAVVAGCVGQGRQRRVRPAIIAVGEKEKVESTNGIGSWESGVRDREKIPGIRDRGFRRILSSTMTKILKIYC